MNMKSYQYLFLLAGHLTHQHPPWSSLHPPSRHKNYKNKTKPEVQAPQHKQTPQCVTRAWQGEPHRLRGWASFGLRSISRASTLAPHKQTTIVVMGKAATWTTRIILSAAPWGSFVVIMLRVLPRLWWSLEWSFVSLWLLWVSLITFVFRLRFLLKTFWEQ